MYAKKILHIWVFSNIAVPQNGWFIMENPIKMDDLGVPLFLETPIHSVETWGQTYTNCASQPTQEKEKNKESVSSEILPCDHHLGWCQQTLANNDIFTNLNWWTQDFWTINKNYPWSFIRVCCISLLFHLCLHRWIAVTSWNQITQQDLRGSARHQTNRHLVVDKSLWKNSWHLDHVPLFYPPFIEVKDFKNHGEHRKKHGEIFPFKPPQHLNTPWFLPTLPILHLQNVWCKERSIEVCHHILQDWFHGNT